MREIKDIKEVQQIVLNIGKEFHRVCVKHNIPYYLHYGGLIGMARHHGFIPWDDDLDFVVPRKYIKQLVKALKADLPDYYKIYDINNDSEMWFEIIKIEDSRTTIKERGMSKTRGIFIDIFPMDYTKKRIRDKILWHFRTIYNIIWHNPESTMSRYISMLENILGKNWLIHSVKYIASKSGKYYTIYSCGPNGTMPVSVFGTPKLYPFEDTEFYCIENYDVALRSIYGDYMKLPPIDQRQTHIEEAYYK